MPRRSSTLETTLTALESLRRIPRYGSITAPELREQLQAAGIARDLRTVQRTLDMLSANFSIERDTDIRPYRYRWLPDAKPLMVPLLGEHESLLLTLAERHLQALLPPAIVKSMASFFDQARANVRPSGKYERATSWLAKVRVVRETQPLIAASVKPGIFETVGHALYHDLWLDVVYTNADKVTSSARVMPLGLAHQGPRMYLVCRFDGHQDDRSLALHRLKKVEATTRPFKRPVDFSLAKYDDEGRFGVGSGKKLKLSFSIERAAGAHLYETPLSTDQLIIEKGDRLIVTATVNDTPQLMWWLQGFGRQVTCVKTRRLVGQ